MPERKFLSVIQHMNVFQNLALIYIKREGNATSACLATGVVQWWKGK